LADNFIAFHATGQPDEMIEVNKKTEVLAYLLKFKKVTINFSDVYVFISTHFSLPKLTPQNTKALL